MIKAVGNIVIGQEFEDKEGSIVVVGKGKSETKKVKLTHVGPGKDLPNGKTLPMHVSVGDVAVISEHVGQKQRIEGGRYLVFRESDIMAVCE